VGVFTAIRAAAAEGTACLIATHNREVLRYTTRTVQIADGLLSEAPPVPAEELAAAERPRSGE
jgi:ABC-type lipoprotein export system ATPase subunit